MECLIVEDLKLSESFMIDTSRNNIYKKIRTMKLENMTSINNLEINYKNYTIN
jgi:hypothetical protein